MPTSPEALSTPSLFADMAGFVWRGDDAAALRLSALAEAPAERTLAGLHIHASTTCHTLTRALAEAVPSVAAALPGADFDALAQAFIIAHPPRRADLYGWGDELPGYLAWQAADPCVVAWARLDRAWLAAIFSPEAQPIEPARLATFAPSDILKARLTSHPSLQLVRLAEPWLASWFDLAAVMHVDRARHPGADGRHTAFARPGAQVRAVAFSPAAYAFLEALHHGQTLVQAYERALAEDSAFDLQTTLGSLFAEGLFTDVLTGSPNHDDE